MSYRIITQHTGFQPGHFISHTHQHHQQTSPPSDVKRWNDMIKLNSSPNHNTDPNSYESDLIGDWERKIGREAEDIDEGKYQQQWKK